MGSDVTVAEMEQFVPKRKVRKYYVSLVSIICMCIVLSQSCSDTLDNKDSATVVEVS